MSRATTPLSLFQSESHMEAEPSTFPGVPEAPSPAQAFFAMYAAEIRGPNYGDHARDWVRTMLARAQVAGIYMPEVT